MEFESSADRLPPPHVPPVVRDGVRYAQAEDGRSLGHPQTGGVLVATAVDTGKTLWSLVVYDNVPDPAMEADAQWVFFIEMAFDRDGKLRIVNENEQAYLVDVAQRSVRALGRA